jgi:tetratricopeptide (TPR) repeat protein
MSDCDVALTLDPNNPWAIQFHGRLKLQSGDRDSAMEAFQQAIKMMPDWAEPREQLSIIHRMKENPQAAVEELTLLIERHPKQVSRYIHRAFAFTQLQEYQQATSDYDRAIELDPENEQLYFLRGVFRKDRQELELALADFERVLALRGDDDNARAHQASILMRLNRYQEAIEIFAKLIEKYPEHPYAYSGRAFASAALGNEDQSQEDADRIAEWPQKWLAVSKETTIQPIFSDGCGQENTMLP